MTVPLRKMENHSETYFGRYVTPVCTGTIKVVLRQPQSSEVFRPIKGCLEIEHEAGNFSGNVEVCFLVSGANLEIPKQWLIPTVNYNGNLFGKGEYPHPKIDKPLGVRADRSAQPHILFQDDQLCYAVGLLGDGPTEGAISGLPASLNWETSPSSVSLLR